MKPTFLEKRGETFDDALGKHGNTLKNLGLETSQKPL
jgi:hypothetical protein